MRGDRLKIIGLTGGIGSGKSTISCILKELGAYIIDEDMVSRLLMEKGQKVYYDIVSYFGPEILKENGDIDRKKLGSIVFADSEKLQALNRITHPAMIKYTKAEIERLMAQKTHKLVVIDAAILIEMGLDKLVDEIWVVYVDRETQIERVMARDGLSYDDALNRINSQMPLDEKLRLADKVIDNTKPLDEVRKQVERLFCEAIE
ncbi:dephospho-CoA kinase [Caldanaerobius fijiensis DSM 17918]|uniref:Dephospho-CoA kinase n=1 Tax=Caldanaerobius fijiensis DSM 17918 TaxID=1121256 RepID=A0A1M4VK42_9THEO|nr:dephospho-CoA kinase [Caldanaerobius fijiensis DSM 17918]